MIIQLPEWDGWRISGERLDWQMQELINDARAEGGKRWKGTNFWPSLEYAIGAAYERTLRESGKKLDGPNEWLDECKRVKDALVKAVKKAVG